MNHPAPRAAIQRLAPYLPPRAREAELCLDFNENTLGCAPAVLTALRQLGAGELARYPEVDAAERAITAAYGHSPATGLLTNGTDDAILLAAMTLLDPGDEVLLFEPSFALYRFYAAQMGALVTALPLRWREIACGVREFHFDLNQALAAVTPRTRLVFVANPNNPTGHMTPAETLRELAARAPQAVIFVDEAYAEFAQAGGRSAESKPQAGGHSAESKPQAGGHSAASKPPAGGGSAIPVGTLLAEVARSANLLVSRTFSKAHGLAGLRLGCLFAPEELMDWLRRAHSPYNVSTVAAVCGAAALRHPQWAEKFAAEARASREAIETTLRELALPYWRSQANFILFDAGPRAAALLAAMRARGVLLRDRGADLAGALRISCGDRRQTGRACALLREAWKEIQ